VFRLLCHDRAAGPPAPPPPEVNEATGLGGWQTVAVRMVDEEAERQAALEKVRQLSSVFCCCRKQTVSGKYQVGHRGSRLQMVVQRVQYHDLASCGGAGRQSRGEAEEERGHRAIHVRPRRRVRESVIFIEGVTGLCKQQCCRFKNWVFVAFLLLNVPTLLPLVLMMTIVDRMMEAALEGEDAMSSYDPHGRGVYKGVDLNAAALEAAVEVNLGGEFRIMGGDHSLMSFLRSDYYARIG
jgi:hypothetical protein